MINLEDRVLAVRGGSAADLTRYLAAEMACNPWAAGIRADCVGLGGEVGLLNPDRVLTHHPTRTRSTRSHRSRVFSPRQWR